MLQDRQTGHILGPGPLFCNPKPYPTFLSHVCHLLGFFTFMYLLAYVRMYKYNLQELVFSFHHVVSGIEFRSSCLPMRAFIH